MEENLWPRESNAISFHARPTLHGDCKKMNSEMVFLSERLKLDPSRTMESYLEANMCMAGQGSGRNNITSTKLVTQDTVSLFLYEVYLYHRAVVIIPYPMDH